MQIDIQHGPAFGLGILTLEQGELVQAEAGAMVSMAGVDMQTAAQGGVMAGLKRAVGGESFFINTFTAQVPNAQLTVAPVFAGEVIHWPLENQTVYLQSGAYMASSPGITVNTKWGGAKTFFSREGLFMLEITGSGDLVLAAYGAVHTLDLAEGQTYTVDTGHMVGWSAGVQYSVRKVGGWKSTILSGEGLVCDLTGPGRIYLQTRSEDSFLGWLIPKIPTSSN